MPPKTKELQLIPLGGLGEIGRNMMIYEYGDDIIIVDAGLMFPDNDMYGINVVIPNVDYLREKEENIRGIIITHGHEDHIGALPYILPQFSVDIPIYASRLARGLIEVKLRSYHLDDEILYTVKPGDTIQLGAFNVSFFHVCHSIPETMGLAIETPLGLIIHATDYKFDPTPEDGWLTDEATLRAYGDRGVLLLLSDSTNAEEKGFTPSEQEINRTFKKIFTEVKGRIIVATFASNLSRVQQLIHISAHFGRRLGVVGRSMVNNVRMGIQLRYLDIEQNDLLTVNEMNSLPPGQVTIVCTGSQGEPTSALVRMARGTMRQIHLHQGDTVIVSATPIPGNEATVNHTIDDLFRRGANVYYHNLFDVHVSGHGNRKDYKHMIELTRPRYFLPIHGEYRHLVLNGHLAEESNIPKENIFIMESGQLLSYDGRRMAITDRVPNGYVLVDGSVVEEEGGQVILRDRRHLSEDGVLVAIVTINAQTGKLVVPPQLLSRGFLYSDNGKGAKLFREMRSTIREIVRHAGFREGMQSEIRDRLGTLSARATGRRPLILPVIVEI